MRRASYDLGRLAGRTEENEMFSIMQATKSPEICDASDQEESTAPPEDSPPEEEDLPKWPNIKDSSRIPARVMREHREPSLKQETSKGSTESAVPGETEFSFPWAKLRVVLSILRVLGLAALLWVMLTCFVILERRVGSGHYPPQDMS